MSSTVMAPSGLEVTSNHEDASTMLESLSGKGDERRPRVLVDAGKNVTEQDESEQAVTEAARELGKKGGKAAAEKRAAEAKEQKTAAKPPAVEKPAAAEGEDDGEEAQAEADDKRPMGKPRDDPRARIQQLSQQKRDTEARLERERQERAQERAELQARLEAIERRVAPPAHERTAEPQPGEPWTPAHGKPVAERFSSYEDYLDARDAFNRHTWEQEQEQRSAQERGRRAVDQAVQTARGRIDKHVESNPGFWDAVSEDVLSLRTTFSLDPRRERPTALNTIADEIFNSEQAPALMLHLSAHPEDLQRIASLPNARLVAREMAKIEDRLSRSDAETADTSSERGVSKAKQPVRSVTGSPRVASPDLSAPMEFDAYVAKRRSG